MLDHDAYVLASPEEYFRRDEREPPEGDDVPEFILTFGETPEGKCCACGTETVAVTTSQWETQPKDGDGDFVEPRGETSGHYCPQCNRLTAVFHHPLT